MCLDKDLYVVFTRAESLGWFRRFLHQDISHCYAMWADGDKWLVADRSVGKTAIFTLNDRNDIIGRIVKVPINDSVNYAGLSTCVSFVKQLIGLNDFTIQTPYQLYKRLK